MIKSFRHKSSFDFFILLLLLILFFVVEAITTRGEYFYSHIGWNDHWYYLGHFEYGPSFELSHLWNYKSSRLIWIWQGAAIFKFLTYPLNIYTIAIYSVTKFWFACWLVISEYISNKRYAFFYIAIFIYYPTLRENGGWFYHNFEASSWWLFSIYLLRLIEREKLHGKFIFIAGLLAGIAINTNLFFVNFLPIFVLLAPSLFYQKKNLLFWSVCGVVSSVPILGTINFLLGGSFHYYLPALKMILEFNGAPELWKPFLYGESLYLFIFLSLISLLLISLRQIKFFTTEKRGQIPFTLAYLYTAGVYLFWHLRGIEVLSINLHNSVLLLMGILLIVEVGENIVSKKDTSLYIVPILFFSQWISIHKLVSFSDITSPFYHLSAHSILWILFTITGTIFSLWMMTKNKIFVFWFSLLSLIPYLTSPYRVWELFGRAGDKCSKIKTENDIVFDIKNEIQKIRGPLVLNIDDTFEIASKIDNISMQNKWPRRESFDENCQFSIENTKNILNSIDFHFQATIANKEFIKKENAECKKWPKYDRLITQKRYKQCNGEPVYFSIYSTQ